jgi:hypothetical protein
VVLQNLVNMQNHMRSFVEMQIVGTSSDLLSQDFIEWNPGTSILEKLPKLF